MAEYRRFVAYVYEYLKGKKGSNCGFIRVEAWGKVCRMEIHLRCPGLLAGTECSVYGFVRKKGLLDGSRIGNCRTEEGKMDCLLETETMAVGHGKIPLGEMNGMVLILESGGFFGTEWDDQPIRPEDFRVMPEVREEPKSDGESKRTGMEAGKTDRGGQEQETEDVKLMGDLQNKNVENAGEGEKSVVNGNIAEQNAGEETMKSQDKSPQDMAASQPEIHTQSIEGQEIEEYPRRPPEPPRPPHGPGPGGPNRPVPPPEPPYGPGPRGPRRPPEPPRPPHGPGSGGPNRPVPSPEPPRPPHSPGPGGPNRPPEPPRPPHQPGPGRPPVPPPPMPGPGHPVPPPPMPGPNRPVPPPPPRPPHMSGQARTSKPIGTPCDAFNDGELTDCRKITPEELCFLGRRACMLRNNRFLQYGYYNFGHLLLCRNTCGQWILGVPGGYDQQERFMANMFGFSYFKESPNIRIPKGKGGYWYRLIDAPNLNS